MKVKKSILIAYCIPYIVFVFLITYYFDYVAKQYPVFLPSIVLILILAFIYIGLGCICGRQGLSKICCLGTAIQIGICKVFISYILPAFYFNTGEINTWFLIISGFIIACQLIGFWGTKNDILNH